MEGPPTIRWGHSAAIRKYSESVAMGREPPDGGAARPNLVFAKAVIGRVETGKFEITAVAGHF
jgi:hypothetical protein